MKAFSIEHPDKGLIVFRDRKRYLWLASLFYPLLALSGIGLYVATGSEWAFAHAAGQQTSTAGPAC